MSTVRNWLGGQHDFFAASSWTPTGQSAPGDTATIGLGSASDPNVAVVQNAMLSGMAVVLDDGLSAADPASNPTLSLSNTIISSDTSIEGHANFQYNPYSFAEALDLKGFVLNQGTISENDLFNTLNVNLADSTMLMNQGTISGGDYDTVNIAGDGWNALMNNGTISGQGSTINVDTPVFGQGEFDLKEGPGFGSHFPNSSTLEFHQMVGSGQTISMTNSTLVLDSPPTFLATIDDLSVSPSSAYASNSSVLLAGEHVTALSFQNNVLTVSDGGNVLAQLNFAPGLAAADFTFNAISGGGGLPAGTDIHIQSPAMGADTTQMAQTASLAVPPLQNQA